MFKKKVKVEDEFKKTEPMPQAPMPQQAQQVADEVVYETRIPEVPIVQTQQQVQQVQQIQRKDWEVKQIATSTEPVAYNNITNKTYTIIEILVEILNRTE